MSTNLEDELKIEWLEYLTNLDYIPDELEREKLLHAWTSGQELIGNKDIVLINELKEIVDDKQNTIDKLLTLISLKDFQIQKLRKRIKKLKSSK